MKYQMHIIFTYKGKVYQAFKKWSFVHCEDVLKRLGASYWEVGIYLNGDNQFINTSFNPSTSLCTLD